jgi:hypothetical protein
MQKKGRPREGAGRVVTCGTGAPGRRGRERGVELRGIEPRSSQNRHGLSPCSVRCLLVGTGPVQAPSDAGPYPLDLA